MTSLFDSVNARIFVEICHFHFKTLTLSALTRGNACFKSETVDQQLCKIYRHNKEMQ